MSIEIPDYCEPVIGWRIWNVHGNAVAGRHLHLASAMSTVWPHYAKLTAVHLCATWHYGPGSRVVSEWRQLACGSLPCPAGFGPGCGIYCFKTAEMLLAQTRVIGPRPVIVGRVALWGRIAEHELGYRGQFAYPMSLHYAFNLTVAEAAALAASYGIPYQEQPLWTLAQSSEDSWQSRYTNQSPHVFWTNQPMTIIPSAWAPIHPTPRPPARPKSRNLSECEQPTFHRGRSIHWIWRRDTWVRDDKERG